MCFASGTAPRRLTGWEPQQGEPEWDMYDVALIRAWKDLQSSLCPQCGMIFDSHDKYPTVDDWDVGFEACPAQAAKEREQKRTTDADKAVWLAWPKGTPTPVLSWDQGTERMEVNG